MKHFNVRPVSIIGSQVHFHSPDTPRDGTTTTLTDTIQL